MSKNFSNNPQRENLLISLLNKVTKEYKALIEFTRREKPLKIVEIIKLSNIPGETCFAIQITNKNCVLQLTAAEIIRKGYNLTDFNDFHADMIREAAQGKLIQFLKVSEKPTLYKIIDKRFDKSLQQYIFTIETTDQVRFTRTTEEISRDKNLLLNMDITDIYDLGFTQGSESILKEKTALLIAKMKNEF